MFIFQNRQGAVYLYKRPAQGIWGGMWSLPQTNKPYNLAGVAQSLAFAVGKKRKLSEIKHSLTHMELHIEPLLIDVGNDSKCLFQPRCINVALPVPVSKIFSLL